MTKKQKEEREAKYGLLSAIKYILLEVGPVYLEGYCKDSDRFEFTYDGHRCRLGEIKKADWENGTIQLSVIAKGPVFREWIGVTRDFDIEHFHYNTLLSIVREGYMCSNMCARTEYEDDFDGWIGEHLSNFFDSMV